MFVLSSGGDHLRCTSSEEVEEDAIDDDNDEEEPYDERRYSRNVIIRCITNSQGNTHRTRDGGYEGYDDDDEREGEYEEKEPPAGGSTITATTVSSSSTTTTMASNPTELMINIIASRSFMNSPIHFADDEEEVANEDDREDYNPIKPTHKYTKAFNDDDLRHGGRHQKSPPWSCVIENTPTSFLFEPLEYCSTSIISYVNDDDDDDDDIVLSGTAGAEIKDDGDDLDIIQSSLLLMDCPFSPPILSSRNNNNCHQVGDNLPTPKKILLLRDAAGNDIEEENRQFRHHHRHSNSSLFLHQQHYSTVA